MKQTKNETSKEFEIFYQEAAESFLDRGETLLTVDDIARMWKINRREVLSMVQGTHPHFHLPCCRFSRKEIRIRMVDAVKVAYEAFERN